MSEIIPNCYLWKVSKNVNTKVLGMFRIFPTFYFRVHDDDDDDDDSIFLILFLAFPLLFGLFRWQI
jgi:hypothetical protein